MLQEYHKNKQLILGNYKIDPYTPISQQTDQTPLWYTLLENRKRKREIHEEVINFQKHLEKRKHFTVDPNYERNVQIQIQQLKQQQQQQQQQQQLQKNNLNHSNYSNFQNSYNEESFQNVNKNSFDNYSISKPVKPIPTQEYKYLTQDVKNHRKNVSSYELTKPNKLNAQEMENYEQLYQENQIKQQYQDYLKQQQQLQQQQIQSQKHQNIAKPEKYLNQTNEQSSSFNDRSTAASIDLSSKFQSVIPPQYNNFIQNNNNNSINLRQQNTILQDRQQNRIQHPSSNFINIQEQSQNQQQQSNPYQQVVQQNDKLFYSYSVSPDQFIEQNQEMENQIQKQRNLQLYKQKQQQNQTHYYGNYGGHYGGGYYGPLITPSDSTQQTNKEYLITNAGYPNYGGYNDANYHSYGLHQDDKYSLYTKNY